jgi:endoglucanase
MRRGKAVLAVVVGLLLGGCTAPPPEADPRFLGVNLSGPEFACVQGFGIDGTRNGQPIDDKFVAAIASWRVNTVRIPLNQDCWLGTNGVVRAYSGANYRRQIRRYVNLLRRNGMTVILDLHWSGGAYPGPQSQCAEPTATCLKPMPDAEHTPEFWRSVATTFATDPHVVFDLFNEPYPDAAMPAAQAWLCWRDGGTACPGIPYPVAGMQTLVDTVRATGATNLIALGGISFANNLSGWLAHRPVDPAGRLAASWHSYDKNVCREQSCWDVEVAPVAAAVPLIAGEIGQMDCDSDYIESVMDWLDRHDSSYLAWAWYTGDCAAFPSLISDYAGTPTKYGRGFRDHLAALPA